jgi:hypothetical protein
MEHKLEYGKGLHKVRVVRYLKHPLDLPNRVPTSERYAHTCGPATHGVHRLFALLLLSC